MIVSKACLARFRKTHRVVISGGEFHIYRKRDNVRVAHKRKYTGVLAFARQVQVDKAIAKVKENTT